MPENEKISLAKIKNNEMTYTKKPSPLVGKQANHFSRSGATLQKCVRRFALAKVSTVRLTEGASVSRRSKTILACVRRLAPIASQGSALPSVFGGSLH